VRILLVWDNRGDRNWGSQATTQALVRLLEARFPGSTITGLPRSAADPSKFWRKRTERWAPLALARDFQGPLDGPLMGLLTRGWEEAYAQADLVLINGEGTLHPQRQTRRWLPALGFLQRRYRKPLWVVNATIECADSPERGQFLDVLGACERIVVRDALSHAELGGLGVPSTLASDCAYLTEPRPFPSPVAGDYAILTGTAAIRSWPLDGLRKAVEALRAEGLAVVFTASDRLDFDLPERLGLELPTVTDREATPQELMGLQAGARILVGGRYHPTILAALAGTPFVSLTSNTFKTQALMGALGANGLLVEPGDNLVGPIRSVLRERDVWSARLRKAATAQIPLARLNVFEP